MICRRLAWALTTVVVLAPVSVEAHADPSVPPGQPVKCVSNTQKGKQVLVPCDLLNAGASFPPGYRCPPPLEQYSKDVADWCGEGPGLAPPTPSPTPIPTPTNPTGPTSPTSPAPSGRTSPTPSSPSSPTPPSPTSPTPSPTPSSQANPG